MKLPIIKGVMDRRILLNYHVDPSVMAEVLPAPFRPKIVRGVAIGGVCLIRLKEIRPNFLPPLLGISSENAAHRIAVEWDDHGEVLEGVYITRRDTSSRLNSLAGGRIFPGVHHHARFRVNETAEHVDVVFRSDDGEVHVAVSATVASKLPEGSVFHSLREASDFFEAGSLGYSATGENTRFDGMELRCESWNVEPLVVESVRTSYFEDESFFPPSSVEFDCALLMRGISHEWQRREELCLPSVAMA